MPAFQGFEIASSYHFELPDRWFDHAKNMTHAEHLVVMYIAKHTWTQWKPRHITLDEFRSGVRNEDGTRVDNGTGLSHQSVINGLKRATRHGYLRITVDDSDRARIKKYYSLESKEWDHV